MQKTVSHTLKILILLRRVKTSKLDIMKYLLGKLRFRTFPQGILDDSVLDVTILDVTVLDATVLDAMSLAATLLDAAFLDATVLDVAALDAVNA